MFHNYQDSWFSPAYHAFIAPVFTSLIDEKFSLIERMYILNNGANGFKFASCGDKKVTFVHPQRGQLDIKKSCFHHDYVMTVLNKIDYLVNGQPANLCKASNILTLIFKLNDTHRHENEKVIVSLSQKDDVRAIFDLSLGKFVVDDRNNVLPIKVDHAMKGIYIPKFKFKESESIFCKPFCSSSDGSLTIRSFEEPIKTISRVGSLIRNSSSVNVPIHHDFFVIKEVSDDLQDFFNTGCFYAPNDFLKSYGVVRGIHDVIGLKGASMMLPANTDEMFFGAKSSVKAAHRGIYEALFDADSYSQSDEGILSALDSKLTSAVFNGVKVVGWKLSLSDIKVTNLYAFYGLRYTDSSLEEGVDPVSHEGSYYDKVMNDMANTDIVGNPHSVFSSSSASSNPYGNYLSQLQEDIKSGLVRYKESFIDMKLSELSVAKFSYDTKHYYGFLKEVNAQASKYSSGKFVELADYFTGIESKYSSYDLNFLKTIANKVFNSRDYPNNPRNFFKTKIPVGTLSILDWVDIESLSIDNPSYTTDPLSYFEGEQGQLNLVKAHYALNILFYGEGIDGFDGLLGDTVKVFNIDGHQFYIPSGRVMSDFISYDEDTKRYHCSGPIQDFLKLLIASRNRSCDWADKFLSHSSSIHKSLLGKDFDRITVQGFSKVLLPLPKLTNGCVQLFDQSLNRDRLKQYRLTFSKMPVLFDRAIHDVVVTTNNNISDPLLRFAFRNSCFVDPSILLGHQNDCDGDMCRLFNTGGHLPVLQRVPSHMQDWKDSYVAGENDLTFGKIKSVKFYTEDDYRLAFSDTIAAEGDVGKYTNNLTFLGNVLEYVSSKTSFDFDKARLIRSGYAMALQDNIVRGLKNEDAKGHSYSIRDVDLHKFILCFDHEHLDTFAHLLSLKLTGFDYDYCKSILSDFIDSFSSMISTQEEYYAIASRYVKFTEDEYPLDYRNLSLIKTEHSAFFAAIDVFINSRVDFFSTQIFKLRSSYVTNKFDYYNVCDMFTPFSNFGTSIFDFFCMWGDTSLDSYLERKSVDAVQFFAPKSFKLFDSSEIVDNLLSNDPAESVDVFDIDNFDFS